MGNPFLERAKKKDTQSPAYWRSRKNEKKKAKDVGGFPVSGSGSGRRKGDVRKSGIVRIEIKGTQAKSFRVTREMIDKIENAALGNGELPVVCVQFLDAKGETEKEVAVLDFAELERLLK